MDKDPRTKPVCDIDCRKYIEKKTIGKSVMRGTRAINTPFVLFPFKVSEIIKADKGPGAIPAARPNVMPYKRDSVISS